MAGHGEALQSWGDCNAEISPKPHIIQHCYQNPFYQNPFIILCHPKDY